jgi:O-antigen/teichoic acid export membrane protein
MATRILGLFSTFILVRILAPEDFGLVALAISFAQAIDWLASIGVNEALIREERLDRALYDTGFTLNLIRGGLMAVAIAAEALPVASLFDDERLAPILLLLALSMFLMAVENVATVDFRRELAFHKDFQLSVIPRIASIVVSIATAVAWQSYWALIAGILTNRFLRLVLSYLLRPYRPRFSLSAWRRIFGFSFWSWVCSVVMMVRDRVDAIVIGRLRGPAQVGVYAVGWEIGALTSTELVEPLTAALFAGFSVARRAGSDLADGYFRAVCATFLLTLPLGLGLSMLAAPIVQLGLGERWMEAVPLVQVFAIVCTTRVIAFISTVLLNAHGMLRVQVVILALGLLVRIALLLVLVKPFGLLGAAVAATACTAVEEVLYLLVTFRRFGLDASNLLRGTWRCLLASVAMMIVLQVQGVAWAPAPSGAAAGAGVIAQAVLTGALAYAVVVLASWWLSGRPRGAETTFLETAGILRRLSGRHPFGRWRGNG